jgi:hypothetical protein
MLFAVFIVFVGLFECRNSSGEVWENCGGHLISSTGHRDAAPKTKRFKKCKADIIVDPTPFGAGPAGSKQVGLT